MHKFFFLFFICLLSVSATANKLPNVEDGKSKIFIEVSFLEKIESIIESEGLTYEEFYLKYPELSLKSNITSLAAEEGILDTSSDSPLGFPGFFWGLCCNFIGLIIILASMGKGRDRDEQIKYGLLGCLVNTAALVLLNILF